MAPSRPRKTSQHRLPIVDQPGLTRALQALEELHGTQTAAAKAVGIRQDSFSKLKDGRHESMTFETYAKILRLLGGEPREFGREPRPVLEFIPQPLDHEVEAIRTSLANAGDEEVKPSTLGDPVIKAVLDELVAEGVAAAGLDEVRERLASKREREAERASDLFEVFARCVVTDDQDFVWAHYDSWMQGELKALKHRAGPIFQPLWADSEYGPHFKRFLEQVGRDGERLPPEDDLRCWLALYRAVAPLADGDTTWGAERRPKEMHQLGDLGPYLEAALAREEILLRPPRDLARVKRAKPPMSRSEWLAPDEEDTGQPPSDLDGPAMLEEP